MTFSANDRNVLLGNWIKPSSTDEVKQQERALKMVSEAINAHPTFKGVSKKIYPKGSYANNTNVRRDSDVDIVVECHEVIYWDYDPSVTPDPSASSPYVGEWTPALWRSEVVKALSTKFTPDDVDTSGKLAINIDQVQGSRPSIDVVPSFHYQRYLNSQQTRFYDGSCVYPKSGARTVNWPQQQLDNGRTKNDRTGKRYKNFVRALKNAENVLAEQGAIDDLPSYFMECLVWNVDNATLKSGDLEQGFRATLVELWQGLNDRDVWEDWEEPNGLKWLFRGKKKWDVSDGRELVKATWKFLDY